MLAGLLHSVADTIVEITPDQIRPSNWRCPNSSRHHARQRARQGAGRRGGRRAATFERVLQSIEMRLSDPNLSIHQIAAEHGISSRYLQKLFESHGESFGQHVKLRRLERCRLDLGSPLHAQRTISEILYQWGFNDSATFSRAFRDRYGVSPREYRKSPERGGPPEQLTRGRPPPARGAHPPEPEPPQIAQASQMSPVRHHYLPARPETIHWGYYSRSLRPVIEVQSGDYVTVETLTHHANDDAERMIHGDAGAEAVFRWTEQGKAVERRGAGPFDASAMGRGPGRGLACISAPGPSPLRAPCRAMWFRCAFSTSPRAPARTPLCRAQFWQQCGGLLGVPLQRPVDRTASARGGDDLRGGIRTRSPPHRPCRLQLSLDPQIDPSGVMHPRIDYPGVPVDPETVEKNFDILRDIEIPVRPHFGLVALAPAHSNWSIWCRRAIWRQHRQLAPWAGRQRLFAGAGGGRAVVAGRSACQPG
jgi:AraC-like DNA-binding protein